MLMDVLHTKRGLESLAVICLESDEAFPVLSTDNRYRTDVSACSPVRKPGNEPHPKALYRIMFVIGNVTLGSI